MANISSCDALAGMCSELVNIRVHHGNGFVNYCDSRVDLSQFQYVDTSVSNPLQMRHADLLGWMHNFLHVDPWHWRIKVSGVVPRQREHGWQWELYEMRNSKYWRVFVDMAMHKIKFPLVVLVQQEMANETQGESSMGHAVPATEVVAEIDWPHENAIAEEHEAHSVVHEQVQHEVEGGDEKFGGDMNA
jgi:hypothetical protein